MADVNSQPGNGPYSTYAPVVRSKMANDLVRRPLSTRNARWAAAVAHWLAKRGLRPNGISVFSVLCASASGACFLGSSLYDSAGAKIILLIGAAICIQLRLLCNLFDGMIAVEGGFRTKSGEVFNDLPDRLADTLILISAGYSIYHFPLGAVLGWLAGLLSVLTAYVRVLGGSCGLKQDFSGPMAKQHRMAVMTAASLLATIEVLLHWPERVIALALAVIVVGCVITITRRTRKLITRLESK